MNKYESIPFGYKDGDNISAKYMWSLVAAAKQIGSVASFNMEEANNYLPARIEITGKTEDSQKFKLELTVGDKNDRHQS